MQQQWLSRGACDSTAVVLSGAAPEGPSSVVDFLDYGSRTCVVLCTKASQRQRGGVNCAEWVVAARRGEMPIIQTLPQRAVKPK